MSKERSLRFESLNNWPKVIKFDIEKEFSDKVNELGLVNIFHPFILPQNDNVEYNKVVSFLLDALYMLPERPDISFDFCWRALEFLSTLNSNEPNITTIIQNTLNTRLHTVIKNHPDYSNVLQEITSVIPHQVCEYLLKKITNESANLGGSKIYKRVVMNNGDNNTLINNLDDVIKYFSMKDYSNTNERRTSANLIKKLLTGDQITLGNHVGAKSIILSESERIRMLTLALLYTFRNDRTHASIISPFKSSKASMKTYAHAWYLFLLTYTMLMVLLKSDDSPFKVSGNLNANSAKNAEGMKNLFGRHIRT